MWMAWMRRHGKITSDTEISVHGTRRRHTLIAVLLCITAAVATATILAVVFLNQSSAPGVENGRVAFMGNSLLFYNDLPRLLEAVTRSSDFVQDSCLRPGASFASLLLSGNGVTTRLATEPARNPDGSYDVGKPSVAALLAASPPWDYVVLHDNTLAFVRRESRDAGLAALIDGYVPLLAPLVNTTPVLLMTHAYLARDDALTQSLGDTSDFTQGIAEYYDECLWALKQALPRNARRPRIAPFGTVAKAVHDDRPEAWKALFHQDGRHLSPSGSYLLACVLHATLFGRAAPDPPDDPSTLWRRARYLQVPEDPLTSAEPFPTHEEAEYLRGMAERVVLFQK